MENVLRGEYDLSDAEIAWVLCSRYGRDLADHVRGFSGTPRADARPERRVLPVGQAHPEATRDDRCPGYCDAPGCNNAVVTDEYCAPHQVLADAGAGPHEMFEADKKAHRYSVTLARLMREALTLIPTDPGA